MKKTRWLISFVCVLLPCFACGFNIKLSSAEEEYKLYNSYKEHPAWSPREEKILFVLTEFSTKGYEYKLCLIDTDGTNFTELPGTTGVVDDNFCWSPNGNGIVFAKRGNSPSLEGDIYVISKDGSIIRKLTNSECYYSQISWSPDGKKIAFTKSLKQQKEIWLIDSKGVFQKLTDGKHPSWSPDGKKIAFLFGHSINIINLEGKTHYSYSFNKPEEWWIVEDIKQNRKILWSLDASKLLFMPERDYNGIFSISIQDNQNKGPALYINSKGNILHRVSGLSLSPNGKEIAFSTIFGISKMDITSPRPYNRNSREADFAKSLLGHVKGLASYGPRLTTTLTRNSEDESPSWSPDARQIVFIRSGEIWLMDSDGSNQAQLTNKQAIPEKIVKK
ncbi:MAG: TolB protein [Parcubacteria group bacterium Licking1014_1]|nr:MAG: TolB protein [Parcubacteria group bacterium Licking1014_1]